MSLRLTLLLTVFVFIGLPVPGQNDGRGATIIYIGGGLLWAHNEDGAHFDIKALQESIRKANGKVPSLGQSDKKGKP